MVSGNDLSFTSPDNDATNVNDLFLISSQSQSQHKANKKCWRFCYYHYNMVLAKVSDD
jgi:hypothetical protein